MKNKDLLTGLENKRLSDALLFIDDALPYCWHKCEGADLTGAELPAANLTAAILSGVEWDNTTCHDRTKNDGSSPCTIEQLNLA